MSAKGSVVRVIPLGGIGEIGKNITVFDDGESMIVIDCGITFPKEEGLFGADVVIPDFTYILQNLDRLAGVVLTHGHEDHIGALPYLMREMRIPKVCATRLTLGMVKAKVDEHGLIGATEWVELAPGEEPLQLGNFSLEFMRVTHSVPDGVALAIHHEAGTIVHTGDVKLDPSPLDGIHTELSRFAEVGEAGVALYLADSTCADIPGHTSSETSVAGPLRDIVARSQGRVIVGCFSSHIHRVSQLIDIAHEHGRAVCILGRSMMRNTNIARNLGYMDVGAAQLLKPHEIGELDPREVMVIGTGSQGEPLAALNRIAKGTHPALDPHELDSVVFSSRTIPGNEVRVHRMINELSRVGCHIYHQDNAPGIHASGHGSAAELTTLLQLVRPRTFMPVHGEWRHMRAHAELGRMAGVKQDNIIFGENGRVVEVANGRARLTDEMVPFGARLVDRQTNEEILDEVMEDRQHLSGDGLIVVVARVRSGEAYSGTGRVEVVTRGIIDEENSTLLEDARDAAESTLSEVTGQARVDLDEIEHLLEESISAALTDRTRRAPMVVPVVIEE